jgi:hypothetical protein
MATTITVEDVERFRATDLRAAILPRHRQVVRDRVTPGGRIVYTVGGQRVVLRQVPGGYTASHACLRCRQGRPCHRALAAVDAEGAARFILQCEVIYHAARLEAAR